MNAERDKGFKEAERVTVCVLQKKKKKEERKKGGRCVEEGGGFMRG